jgi:hypothetical protein
VSPATIAGLLAGAGLLFLVGAAWFGREAITCSAVGGATFAEMGPTDEVDDLAQWAMVAAVMAGLFALAAGALLTLAALEVLP